MGWTLIWGNFLTFVIQHQNPTTTSTGYLKLALVVSNIMSAESQPITPARFAAALPDLTVESLHAKAAEIRNSIAHLKSSNEQLREFAMEGDKDCYEAMVENEEVIERMEHRIEMLKAEVEGRGLRWIEEHEKPKENGAEEGEDANMEDAEDAHTNGTAGEATTAAVSTTASAPASSGRLTDEDLRRLLTDRMDDDDEEGVHL